MSSTTSVAPEATFGAAAAAIQQAIAAGLAQQAQQSAASASLATMSSASTTTTTTTSSSSIPDSTTTTTTTVSSTSTLYVGKNAAPSAAVEVAFTNIAAAAPVTTTKASTSAQAAAGASIGSQGTITVNGDIYTTVVVASYVTVAAQPTTFYENGIAYVASYAGETITVSNCPCTRSAQIVFLTTTLCGACDGSAAATATSATGPSVATESGEAVVFTGSAPPRAGAGAAGLQTVLIGGVVIVLSSLLL